MSTGGCESWRESRVKIPSEMDDKLSEIPKCGLLQMSSFAGGAGLLQFSSRLRYSNTDILESVFAAGPRSGFSYDRKQLSFL
jgi:hypothetical protein